MPTKPHQSIQNHARQSDCYPGQARYNKQACLYHDELVQITFKRVPITIQSCCIHDYPTYSSDIVAICYTRDKFNIAYKRCCQVWCLSGKHVSKACIHTIAEMVQMNLKSISIDDKFLVFLGPALQYLCCQY